MKKKVIVLVSLLIILIIVSVLSVKKVASALEKQDSMAVQITKNQEVGSLEETKSKKKSIFDEEQVLTEEIYPKVNLETGILREDVLPKGTVVSIKPVENNDEWVEIISDPSKGFIEKKHLEPRDVHINERESKRKNSLSHTELTAELDKAVTDFMKEHGGDVSVYIETADETYNYGYGSDRIRRTASSIKLPFIAYLMNLADENKLDMQKELTYTANFKYGGTGIIQFEPIGSTYTVEKLAELVIRYSDNVAYFMLLNHIGEQAFIQFLQQLDPMSPNDRFFSSPQILSKAMKYVIDRKDNGEHMNQLYGWMQNSTFDDGVDVGLPGVDVVHKTGWMPMYTVSNDVSFVEDKKNPYYLTIMTSGYDDSYSEKSISDLSFIIDEIMLQMKTDEK